MRTLTMLLMLSLLVVFVWAGDEDAKHQAMVESLIGEVWNEGNVEKVDAIFAANFVRHMPKSWEPNKVEGVAALKEYVKEVRSGYETLQVKRLDSVSKGNTVALRWNLSGKMAESGKQVDFDGLSFMHLNDDGKIAQEWIIWDTHDVMKQTGMLMMGKEHGEHSTEKH